MVNMQTPGESAAHTGSENAPPARGEIRLAPEGDSCAYYTPTGPRDKTPWTVTTCDHRHLMRTVDEVVREWAVIGHLDQQLVAPSKPAQGDRIRVFRVGDDLPADVPGVVDRAGEIWPAHEWVSGTTTLSELVRISGPLVEIPAVWLAHQATPTARS